MTGLVREGGGSQGKPGPIGEAIARRARLNDSGKQAPKPDGRVQEPGERWGKCAGVERFARKVCRIFELRQDRVISDYAGVHEVRASIEMQCVATRPGGFRHIRNRRMLRQSVRVLEAPS
jgi:hypothetical protein